MVASETTTVRFSRAHGAQLRACGELGNECVEAGGEHAIGVGGSVCRDRCGAHRRVTGTSLHLGQRCASGVGERRARVAEVMPAQVLAANLDTREREAAEAILGYLSQTGAVAAE